MNRKNNIVALIESPFQCLCLIELILRRKIKNDDVLIIFNKRSLVSSLNETVFRNVLDFFEMQDVNVRIIDVNFNLRGVVRNKKHIKSLLKSLSGEFELFVIGEFRSDLASAFSSKINYKEKVYLDDGNAMFRLEFCGIAKEKYKDKIKKKLVSFFTGLEFDKQEDGCYFSKFLSEDANPSLKIEKHSFENLRSWVVKNESVKVDVIVGAPLYSAGVMTEELEFAALNLLFDRIESDRLIYIPHRRESKKKIDYIKDNFNVEVDDTLLPFELKYSKYLGRVYGFYSTCFDTVVDFYSDVEIFSFKLDISDVNNDWVSFVRDQYERYERNGSVSFI